MRTVRTQVIFNGLLVAHVNEEIVEDAHLGSFVGRNEQTALQHILKKSYCLEAHRLTTSIRTGNNQYPLLGSQFQFQRLYLFFQILEFEIEQRVFGFV